MLTRLVCTLKTNSLFVFIKIPVQIEIQNVKFKRSGTTLTAVKVNLKTEFRKKISSMQRLTGYIQTVFSNLLLHTN